MLEGDCSIKAEFGYLKSNYNMTLIKDLIMVLINLQVDFSIVTTGVDF